jgi:hypothetical protein
MADYGAREGIDRRVYSWRRSVRSRATGPPSTTGVRPRRRLNALPQFTTEIDGVDIHFIHVRSRIENALPLIMTHGWPGSVIELLETVGPLTDPTSTAARRRCIRPGAAVVARLRLLGEPTELGWDSAAIAARGRR